MLTLRETRRRAFISQQELADQTGLNKTTIMRLEAGKHWPMNSTARKIAKVLKVKPQEIDW